MSRGHGRVRTEAEAGVRLPQAKDYLEPPEAGRDTEEFSRRGCGKAWLCQHWFWTWGLQNSERIDAWCFKPSKSQYFVTKPLETNTPCICSFLELSRTCPFLICCHMFSHKVECHSMKHIQRGCLLQQGGISAPMPWSLRPRGLAPL